MAPAVPLAYTAGQNPIPKFEGAIVTEVLPSPPSRVFLFRTTFFPNHPRLLQLASSGEKPPMHFHPYQSEFFKVLKGSLTVEVAGRRLPDGTAQPLIILTPDDPELELKPGPNHRLYPTEGVDQEEVVMLLSASDTGPLNQRLDLAFFENWYGYQDDFVCRGAKIDPIQVMCMFDAGDSYLTLPSWIPFSQTVAYALGIVVGRWIGGALGYRPFYPEWTTDWGAACDKMEKSVFQRRFADRSAQRDARLKWFGESGADAGQ